MRSIAIGMTIGAVLTLPLPTLDSIDQPAAIAVISQSDLAENTVTDIESLLAAVPSVSSYRYGDNPRGTATLDRDTAPAATPDLLGAMVIRPGDIGFRGLTSSLENNAIHYQSVGEGVIEANDYLFFIASREAPRTASEATGLATQIDFPIGFEGEPGWVAQSAFPGDTWQGAGLVLSSQLGVDGTYRATLIDIANNFLPRDFDGMFATGPDWAIAAVDIGTLTEYSTQPILWGFASHVHDGSFGSCADCSSIVTAYPAVPRSSAELYQTPIAAIVLSAPSAEASPRPSATTAETQSTPAWLPVLIIALVVLIVLAILLTLAWIMLARRKPQAAQPRACDPERRALDDATRRRDTAREFLETQNGIFNDRMARVGEIETQLAEYERALDGPTAGSGGTEFARLDGELIVVGDLEELVAHLQSDLAEAQSEVNREKAELDRRLAQFADAESEEDAARSAYESCIAAASAAAPSNTGATPTPTQEPGPQPGSSGPTAVVTATVSSVPRADCGCEQSTVTSPAAVPVGAPQRFRLFRDFDVVSHVDESSQHGADKVGADMVTGLKDAGVTMTTIGSALSGRSAALGGAKAVGSLQTGQFIKGSLQGVKGTVDGLGAVDVIPNVPTSLPEAVAQGLAATANLGAFVAGKVTEWMGKNTLISVHASYYFQTVTIQPTQIWECEEGAWRCKTLVNVYTVGSLERERGGNKTFTVKSDPERRALRVHLARLASRGRSRITTSVSQIASWEAAHPTGDCP